jgi:hypothetical protein
MKFGLRTVAGVAALLILAVASLTYFTGDHLNLARKGAGEARNAVLQSYRIAQSVKALTAGYELTMNEYYSTVLEFPAYQKKSGDQKRAIEQALDELAKLPDGNAQVSAEFAHLYREFDAYRLSLERALGTPEKDWDQAREALYKMNLLSVQAIHRADTLGQFASELAASLENSWQSQQAQALQLLQIAMLIAAVTGLVLLFGAARGARAPV